MAGPELTKKALASALKELVKKNSFEKVTVMDICEACGVSRKTFYYHFKDKFDLAEWIFDVEFIEVMKRSEASGEWEFASAICHYFYREKEFYSKLLQYGGQNSFRQYFQSFMFDSLMPFLLPSGGLPAMAQREDGAHSEAVRDFYVHFVSDAVLLSIFRWLVGGAKIPPEEFLTLLKGASDLLHTRVQEVLSEQ